MRLEIGNFYVRNIIFGEKLSFESGILTINKDEALTYIRADERITEAELYIAKPGDMSGKRGDRASCQTGWERSFPWIYRRSGAGWKRYRTCT